MESEYQLDLEELQTLILKAQRPRIKKLLQDHRKNIQLNIQKIVNQKPKPLEKVEIQQPIKQQKEKRKLPPGQSFTSITSYSWDQQGSKIKIIISMNGIGEQVKADQVEVDFKKDSVQVCIYQFNGKNYRFSIKKTFGSIDPQYCKYLIKKNSFNLVLIKKQDKHWDGLNYKESALKPEKLQEKGKQDPNAAMMDMMKKMYQQGDPQMKRTIAQAWTKSQQQKLGK